VGGGKQGGEGVGHEDSEGGCGGPEKARRGAHHRSWRECDLFSGSGVRLIPRMFMG
jgi:hypothetical protein